ncbi:MAG TPA: DEAD/DEAH box helicase [Candidatus Dormibacteraeota bacterium]|nr:DEAD/DEAH box helicase [Candidatus Dormibacteraeota bacterium]
MTSTFADLGISPRLLKALEENLVETPVPVQAEAIPPLMSGRHVVIEAPTGSGKTLAFLLPLAERLMVASGPGPRALVVTPTRELAMQVAGVLESLKTGLRPALLYGGVGYATQESSLKRGADVVVGTPGRILDMVSRRRLSLNRVQFLVLDEGDEMLDAGFAPAVEEILQLTYQPQVVLASATMPAWVSRMIERHMQEPVRIRVEGDDTSTLEHSLVRVNREEKLQTLSRLLQGHRGSAIVFGRTKYGVRKLNSALRKLGHDSAELQGNLSQAARDRTMDAFRENQLAVLVATNVAARGLDIRHVDLVINYELPDSPQWLTHRVGRTARMGVQGRALTFVGPEDERAWNKLRREGAPALLELDLAHLLAEGDWRQVAASEALPAPGRSGRVRPIRSDFGRPQRAARTSLSNRPTRRKRGSRGGVSVMPKGTVKKVVSDRGFGFIAADDGKEYFFHQSGVDSTLNFDSLRGGEAVSFDIEQSQKGPRANRVRAA